MSKTHDSDLFLQTWRDFLEHRKQSKKPMTEIAKDRMLMKLSKYDIQIAIAMLEQSMENSWSGVFELKGQSTNNMTLEEYMETKKRNSDDKTE